MIPKSGTRFSDKIMLKCVEVPPVPCRNVAALALLLALSFAAPAFAQFRLAQFKKDLPPVTCANVESIGTAEMAADGTVTLHLKSLWPDPKEDSDLTYAPDDPQYDDIKKHLGGITPGQSKPIPPFC
jgi:hypothetical protein